MLIKAQCDALDMGKALQILEDMLQNSCDVDDVVFTHLIEGCCHVNNVALATIEQDGVAVVGAVPDAVKDVTWFEGVNGSVPPAAGANLGGVVA